MTLSKYTGIFLIGAVIALCSLSAAKADAHAMFDEDKVSPEIAAAPDTVHRIVFYFKVNGSVLDRSYRSNAESLARLEEILLAEDADLLSLDLNSSTSPDGKSDDNRSLSKKRADVVHSHIAQIVPLSSVEVTKQSGVCEWEDLNAHVVADANVPHADILLEIIRDDGIHETGKISQIMKLKNGATYTYIKGNTLPLMRTCVVTLTMRGEEAAVATETAPEPESESASASTPETAPKPEPVVVEELVAIVEVTPEPQPTPEPAPAPEYITTFPVALRTNLLSDVIGGPNLGIEVPLVKKFSLAADFAYINWRIKNSYSVQGLEANLEGRYWFNPKKGALTGWNLGVYGMYGNSWDVQWNGGYQGDHFVSVGLTAGYSLPIARILNLDFALAAGWFYTPEARHYVIGDGDRLMWQNTRNNVHRFSLTKAKVSLILLIGKKKKISE